jgi:hypothetical protein
VAPEDLLNPSLLGAGEHDWAIVAEQHHVGQWPRSGLKPLGCRLAAALLDTILELLGASGLGSLDRVQDARAAVARHPDPLTLNPAVQLAAAAMLLHEGVEGSEQFRQDEASSFLATTEFPLPRLLLFVRTTFRLDTLQ